MASSGGRFYFIIRVCLLLLFFVSAIHTLFNWDEKAAQVTSILCHWFAYLQSWQALSKITEYFIDQVPIFLGLSIFFQIIGSLSLLFMVQPRGGAICILIFLIPMTLVCHPFWFGIGDSFYQQLNIFLKNLALIGLYILVACRPYVLGQRKQ